jgi:hypothetical protein
MRSSINNLFNIRSFFPDANGANNNSFLLKMIIGLALNLSAYFLFLEDGPVSKITGIPRFPIIIGCLSIPIQIFLFGVVGYLIGILVAFAAFNFLLLIALLPACVDDPNLLNHWIKTVKMIFYD